MKKEEDEITRYGSIWIGRAAGGGGGGEHERHIDIERGGGGSMRHMDRERGGGA